MANVKTKTAHYFDAVGSFILPCTINAFHWGGTATAGDTVSVSEWSGTAANVIFKEESSTDKATPSLSGLRLSVAGFRVDTIDSGYLLVYTE